MKPSSNPSSARRICGGKVEKMEGKLEHILYVMPQLYADSACSE